MNLGPQADRSNTDPDTVEGFGREWSTFDHSRHSKTELSSVFDSYFSIFPWHELPPRAVGFDLGCGTGRWAVFVAPRVGTLHCVDASDRALAVARQNLTEFPNCHFHHASVDALPFEDGTFDFGYSLGVLHHVPDTAAGLGDCVRKLKPGAPFLVYLYYAFDNRSRAYRSIWQASDLLRRGISRAPFGARYAMSQVIAATVYWPLARLSSWLEERGYSVDEIPLAPYRNRSFYVMRTDALDRFGTKLEQRFTRNQIEAMMREAGLERIKFSGSVPFWTAVGYRA